jgi:copper(I)-binding protein
VNRALRAATLGVLLFSPVALSACSSGQVTQTATQQRDKTGGQAQVGDISVRQVRLAFPDSGSYASGANAELQMAIANDGPQDDALTSVTGTGFQRAVFTDVSTASATGSSAAATSSSAAATSSGAAATSSGAPATTATPTGTAGGTATGTAPASAVPTEIPVPARSTVFVGQDDTHITLIGLDQGLTTGQYVTLVLTFAKAGEVTVKATVATPPQPLERSSTYDFNQSESAG